MYVLLMLRVSVVNLVLIVLFVVSIIVGLMVFVVVLS